jgi:hypothetical protein
MIRDQEIKRLEQYSAGLGLPVRRRKYDGDGTGAKVVIAPDGNPEYMLMNIWPGKSKTQIILDLLHEIGHQLGYIYNGRQDPPELIAALQADKPTKKQRKLIYEMEKRDAQYRVFAYQETNVKIPKEKLMADIDLDVWFYRQWYLTGKACTARELSAKRDELRRKYASTSKTS